MITLQTKRAAPERQDAISWLLSCHDRIRHFTSLAQKIATTPAASDAERREAAEAVHKYFTVALPLHEQDEEESLTPMLRGASSEIDAALLQMASEHREIDVIVERLASLMRSLIDDPAELSSLSQALTETTSELSEKWLTHLSLEEQRIFPFAQTHLTDPQKETLHQQMQSHRQRAANAPALDPSSPAWRS